MEQGEVDGALLLGLAAMYWLTFACAWLEPGEFLLCSVGEISDSGRGIALCVLDGIGIVLPLERRRGCT